MKKFTSVVLTIIIVFTLTLTGCGSSNDYVVNNDNVIKIGVLASNSDDTSYGAKVLAGIKYAAELAPSVNIKDKYIIELSIYDINDDATASADKLINDKVAAVICAAETKSKSDEIIDAFDGESTPLLFVDCYSDEILSDDESFTLSIPYTYQSSVLASYFINEGFRNGAVICADDSYSKGFVKSFNDTFVNTGGNHVAEYFYSDDVSQFDTSVITSTNPEFIFIIGNNSDCISLHKAVKATGLDAAIALSEVFDKTQLETSAFNETLFISKLEVDVNNYIGADFLSVFSTKSDTAKADIPSAVAYGYDAYMIIYGALMGFNTSLGTADGNADNTTDAEVTVSEVKTSLTEIVHLGVTDSIKFDDSGLVNTNFVYLSSIENSNSLMLNRYNYSNENN